MVAFSNLFHWRDDYIRYGVAIEAMKAERRRFETLAHPDYKDYPPSTRDRLLHVYVERMEAVMTAEFGEWRAQQERDRATQS